MIIYAGHTQKVYQLEDTSFKAGGEGRIYNILNEPGLVAKIYKSELLSHELEAKILAMVSTIPRLSENFLSMCAWPQDALYDAQHHFAGFVMARISGQESLRYVFTCEDRTAPWSCYLHIAKNLAAAVHNIHAIGQVIGDLNPGNILVDVRTGLLTLIDAASFHVRTSPTTGLRCKVGMPRYVAPELQGKSFDSIPFDQSFSQDSDNFSLAVLIFQILMNGVHPFICGVTSEFSASTFQPVDNIQNGLCPYFIKTNQTAIPLYAPEIQCLPPEIQALFRRAFVDGHKNPAARPHADEWYRALDILSKQLKTCVKNVDHVYYRGTAICPWCEVEQKMKSLESGESTHSEGEVKRKDDDIPGKGGSGTDRPKENGLLDIFLAIFLAIFYGSKKNILLNSLCGSVMYLFLVSSHLFLHGDLSLLSFVISVIGGVPGVIVLILLSLFGITI